MVRSEPDLRLNVGFRPFIFLPPDLSALAFVRLASLCVFAPLRDLDFQPQMNTHNKADKS
jgi:hypothetical protein